MNLFTLQRNAERSLGKSLRNILLSFAFLCCLATLFRYIVISILLSTLFSTCYVRVAGYRYILANFALYRWQKLSKT